jgi:hypothetical protein
MPWCKMRGSDLHETSMLQRESFLKVRGHQNGSFQSCGFQRPSVASSVDNLLEFVLLAKHWNQYQYPALSLPSVVLSILVLEIVVVSRRLLRSLRDWRG